MLAKLWKKVLLAVCLVACLFNITYKLVNRHSLKENLQSVNNGETIFDLSKDKSPQETYSGISNNNNSGNDSSNSDENSEYVEHKNEGYYDEDGNYRLYRDEENNESYTNRNEGSESGENSENEESQDYESSESGDGNEGNRQSNINVKNAISNARDKIKNVDIDVQPAEATEVYEDIPVYDENDPQRNAGNNSEYEYTWRDFLDIFKSK